MTTRRTWMAGAASAAALAWLPRPAFADARQALAESPLIYLTPLKSNGEESRCKAEIWFAHVDGDAFVVTPPDAWRAEAVGRGLTRARVWVGDFGVWTRSGGAFREAPELMATASIESDTGMHERVLEAMGAKYADSGWRRWGDEFRQGLVDGGRVMIRYDFDS